MKNQLIILTAPSGSGKTTIARWLLAHHPELGFSVSACTRPPRPGEQEGRDYYFLSPGEFKEKINAGEFAEYEMVYEGKYYGTLISELVRIWKEGRIPLVDIDVRGAMNLKSRFGPDCLSIFIQPPSLAQLESRLKARGTETPEMLAQRVQKAVAELDFANHFDRILVNDNLEEAKKEADGMVSRFLQGLP